MKYLSSILVFTLLSLSAMAQTTSPVASTALKLDSLVTLSQRFMNNNQPDSLYALMGDTFKKQISADKMKEVMNQITGQLGKWTTHEPKGVTNGIARYKATFALAPIDFYISQDKQGKIETFLFKPWQE